MVLWLLLLLAGLDTNKDGIIIRIPFHHPLSVESKRRRGIGWLRRAIELIDLRGAGRRFERARGAYYFYEYMLVC